MVANKYDPLPEHLRVKLVELFLEDIRYIEGFLGVSLEQWKLPNMPIREE
jgi:hypothetical protein